MTTTCSVLEYWARAVIARVASIRDLWTTPRGQHRKGWFEPSTFAYAADNWGRMARVIDAERKPVPEPLPAPPTPLLPVATIGDRARRGLKIATQEVRIVVHGPGELTDVFADGTRGYAIGNPAPLERRAA